jgi:hypothetical protein
MHRSVVIVPSRGRPDNIARLVGAWMETATWDTDLVVAVDEDDPELGAYEEVVPPWGDLQVGKPSRIGPILNRLGPELAEKYEVVGFMGDDHLPRTQMWDEWLAAPLRTYPGVAYGNDLHQSERLPTMCMISSGLIRGLGYMVPPGLVHLFLDDFWRQLGTDVGRLSYYPEVVIEHLHPVAGKAPYDPGYTFSMAPGLMEGDRLRYQKFLAEDWPADLAKLRASL